MDLEHYGPIGVVGMIGIAAITWLVKFIKDMIKDHKSEREDLERLHRIERDDFRKTIEKQFDESNKQTNNATQALTELTTLLKNKK